MTQHWLDYRFRPAASADAAAICRLIQQLANDEGMPQGPHLLEDDIRAYIECTDKGPAGLTFLLVELETDDKIVALCVYFTSYACAGTERPGLVMFVEDAIVERAYRRHGLGRALFCYVSRVAADNGIASIQFNVLASYDMVWPFYRRMDVKNWTGDLLMWRIDPTLLHRLGEIPGSSEDAIAIGEDVNVNAIRRFSMPMNDADIDTALRKSVATPNGTLCRMFTASLPDPDGATTTTVAVALFTFHMSTWNGVKGMLSYLAIDSSLEDAMRQLIADRLIRAVCRHAVACGCCQIDAFLTADQAGEMTKAVTSLINLTEQESWTVCSIDAERLLRTRSPLERTRLWMCGDDQLPPIGYRVRHAIGDDAVAVNKLIHLLNEDSDECVPQLTVQQVRQYLDEPWRGPPDLRFIVVDSVQNDGSTTVIGVCFYFTTYAFVGVDTPGFVVFVEVAVVEKEHQRRGLGRYLFAHVARDARNRGVDSLQFNVLGSHAGAWPFYQRLGVCNWTAAAGLLVFRIEKPEMRRLAERVFDDKGICIREGFVAEAVRKFAIPINASDIDYAFTSKWPNGPLCRMFVASDDTSRLVAVCIFTLQFSDLTGLKGFLAHFGVETTLSAPKRKAVSERLLHAVCRHAITNSCSTIDAFLMPSYAPDMENIGAKNLSDSDAWTVCTLPVQRLLSYPL